MATKWSNKFDYFGLMSKWRVHVTTRQIKLTLIASSKQPQIWKLKRKLSCGRLQCVCIILRRADVSPPWESLTGMWYCAQEWCKNPSWVYTHFWRDKFKNSFLGCLAGYVSFSCHLIKHFWYCRMSVLAPVAQWTQKSLGQNQHLNKAFSCAKDIFIPSLHLELTFVKKCRAFNWKQNEFNRWGLPAIHTFFCQILYASYHVASQAQTAFFSSSHILHSSSN